MTKLISTFTIALMFVATISKAQTTAMNFNKMDCNGNQHNLFADLDAGNVVILHFFMPNCGSCPPPAQKIQKMANNVMKTHPGKIKAYALPYNNSTTCSYSATWVSSNGLSLYAPLDSGAAQVAYYGGFGMPTVVVLGGKDHKILFSTQSFSTSDTTDIRDAILASLNSNTGIAELPSAVKTFSVFPNPASENVSINFDLNETSTVLIDITDITGKQVAIIMNEKQNGVVTKQFNTAALPNGNYFVRLQTNGKTITQKLNIAH